MTNAVEVIGLAIAPTVLLLAFWGVWSIGIGTYMLASSLGIIVPVVVAVRVWKRWRRRKNDHIAMIVDGLLVTMAVGWIVVVVGICNELLCLEEMKWLFLTLLI